MKKILIILFTIQFLLFGCAQDEQVLLLKQLVSPSTANECSISPDAIEYNTHGYVDVAVASNYILGFIMENMLNPVKMDSKTSGNPYVDDSMTTGEPNYITLTDAVLTYHLPSGVTIPASNARDNLGVWQSERRVGIKGVSVGPNDKATGSVHLFSVEQMAALNEIQQASTAYDWQSSPLVVDVRVEGERSSGDTLVTNTLSFNIVPIYGQLINWYGLYEEPDNGYADEQEEYEDIMEQCTFELPSYLGCVPGVDEGYVSCGYMPNLPKIAEQTRPSDGYSWRCCPEKEPEKPEETGG